MDAAIINKFGLQVSTKTVGKSFVNGIPVYLYKGEIFLSTCDTTGEPQGNGNILVFKNGQKNFKYFSPDFLLDVPINEFDRICGLT